MLRHKTLPDHFRALIIASITLCLAQAATARLGVTECEKRKIYLLDLNDLSEKGDFPRCNPDEHFKVEQDTLTAWRCAVFCPPASLQNVVHV